MALPVVMIPGWHITLLADNAISIDCLQWGWLSRGISGRMTYPGAGPIHLDRGPNLILFFRGRLAQVDRALVSGTKGRAFESPIAHHVIVST